MNNLFEDSFRGPFSVLGLAYAGRMVARISRVLKMVKIVWIGAGDMRGAEIWRGGRLLCSWVMVGRVGKFWGSEY